jgi:hypothetical protein
MKKIIILFLFGLGAVLILMAFTSTLNSPPDKGDYILVEIYEVPTYPDRGVHIHYGNNKREVIKFPGMEIEHHDEAGDITLNTINKLVAEGYQIEHTSSGVAQSGMITKIFMRKT